MAAPSKPLPGTCPSRNPSSTNAGRCPASAASATSSRPEVSPQEQIFRAVKLACRRRWPPAGLWSWRSSASQPGAGSMVCLLVSVCSCAERPQRSNSCRSVCYVAAAGYLKTPQRCAWAGIGTHQLRSDRLVSGQAKILAALVSSFTDENATSTSSSLCREESSSYHPFEIYCRGHAELLHLWTTQRQCRGFIIAESYASVAQSSRSCGSIVTLAW